MRGQCFFLDGAHGSLTPLEPEPFSNQLLAGGAVAGVGGASEKGETFSLGRDEGGAERLLGTGGSRPTWLHTLGPTRHLPAPEVLFPAGRSAPLGLLQARPTDLGRRSGDVPAQIIGRQSTCSQVS